MTMALCMYQAGKANIQPAIEETIIKEDPKASEGGMAYKAASAVVYVAGSIFSGTGKVLSLAGRAFYQQKPQEGLSDKKEDWEVIERIIIPNRQNTYNAFASRSVLSS